MVNGNKKLSAFMVGCFMVWACAWLIDFGYVAPVPESFQTNSHFVANYYPMMVTAILASIFAIGLTLLLPKVFNVRVNEYFLWLTLPMVAAIALTSLVAQALTLPFISASLPVVIIFSLVSMIEKRDLFLPERLKVW